ncbi:MAG: serine/threonine-protein kinase, partial [Myxococcota bacterium]
MSFSSDTPPPSGTLLDTGAEAEPSIKRRAGLELGRVFGRYVVLQHIGAGGAGTVYAAYDPELNRKVALKVLNDERPRSRQRLMREAQAIAKVTHPNIVAVHDVGTHQGRVYIAMEFVDGFTLRRWLAVKTRPWQDVLDKLNAAGEGLAAAHDAGLVHRDFKPDNVLVDRAGRVVVLDFGLARRASTAGDSRQSEEDQQIDAMLRTPRHTPLDINITGAGALMGTPAYMAPEQHLRQRVDARTDQFSFCVVFWEALYGERPFA